jgi:hypothetical protein
VSACLFASVKPDSVERFYKKFFAPDITPGSHEGTPIEAVEKYTLTLRQGLSGSQTKKDTLLTASNRKDDDSGGTVTDAGKDLKAFRAEL